MPPIERLLQGFSSFRENYFENDNTLFEQLSREGQKPSTLLIACSDSRVDPAILFGVEPGDLLFATWPIWCRRMNQMLVFTEQALRLNLRFEILRCHTLLSWGTQTVAASTHCVDIFKGNDWSEILSNAGCRSQRMRSSLMCVMNLPVPSKRRFVHRLKT